MKTGHKHYILMIWAIVCLIISIFSYLVIYRKTIDKAENYLLAKREAESETFKKQYEEELFKIFESSKDDRGKINSLIIEDDNVIDFIQAIENISSYSNAVVDISSINKEGGVLKANVKIDGTWSNIFKSLIFLENINFPISINNIRLTSKSSLDSKNTYDWSMLIDINIPIYNK